MSEIDITEPIRRFYDDGAEHEWDRHDRHFLEFPVTMHFLMQSLAPESRILDEGSGPGRYALDLTMRGHRLNLLDLSEKEIEIAREKARQQGVEFESAGTGDARDLSCWRNESFDAVLCLGPLYHLQREMDRRQVLSEAARVLKPGGLLAAAYISRFAPVYDLAKRFPDSIRDAAGRMKSYLETGRHTRAPGNDGFVDAWFANPEQIDLDFAGIAVQRIMLFGAEGGLAQSEPRLLEQGSADRQAWLDLAIHLAPTSAGIFGSEHLVVLARKTV
jgi:S-adenosylmethionine-dependent methyltransferase